MTFQNKKKSLALPRYNTGEVKSVMCFLNEPSTKFKPEGEFSVKCVGTSEDFKGLIEVADKAIEEKIKQTIEENPKVKKLVKPVKPYKPEFDDEGDETGNLVVNFKRAHKQTFVDKKSGDKQTKVNKVILRDSAGKLITDQVWSGSKMVVRYFLTPYYSPKDHEVGVSLKIDTVFVTELVGPNGSDAEDEVDMAKMGLSGLSGYKAGKAAGTTDAGGDDTDEDTGSTGDDDNSDF
jgi:hypothetical protein